MSKDKCTLSDSELITKANEWTLKLCENHNNWMLRVPPDCNHDPDMIYLELADRFEKTIKKTTSNISIEEKVELFKKLLAKEEYHKFIEPFIGDIAFHIPNKLNLGLDAILPNFKLKRVQTTKEITTFLFEYFS